MVVSNMSGKEGVERKPISQEEKARREKIGCTMTR